MPRPMNNNIPGYWKLGLIIVIAYILIQFFFFNLDWLRLIIVACWLRLFSSNQHTHRLSLALIPFLLIAVLYDWLSIIPSWKLQQVDILDIYGTERRLFGIETQNSIQIPSEWFAAHKHAFFDVLAALLYLLWFPFTLSFAIFLYFNKKYNNYARYTFSFVLLNLFSYVVYYAHPTAPPWYPMNHGMDFDPNVIASEAGLASFDRLIHIPFFHFLFKYNSNPFAALPATSLANILLPFIYCIIFDVSFILSFIHFTVFLAFAWAALYTAHHYILTQLAAVLIATEAVFLLEKPLLSTNIVRRAAAAYARQLSPSQIE